MYPLAKIGAKIRVRDAQRHVAAAAPSGCHVLTFDGGCVGNGTPRAVGTWAFVLADTAGNRLGAGSGRDPGKPATCNSAEWCGVLEGLRVAATVIRYRPGLLIRGDSFLVINQLLGRWGVRDDRLRALAHQAHTILGEIGVAWFAEWVPREMNTECDAMASAARG